MRIFRRFHLLRVFVVLACVAVTILGVMLWLRASHLENTAASVEQFADSPYRPVSMKGTQRTSALFVGDDFPAGYGEVSRNAYPYIVCSSIGLNCNVDAQTGTGFVNDGRDHLTGTFRLIDRLQTDRKIYEANLIIVDAGRNDLDAPTDVYGAALERYLREVSQLWPAAKIVVIAPSHLSAEPYSDYTDRIPMISQIVDSARGILIDPVAERWYVGVDTSALVLPDGVHPNQRGQEFIAKKLGESLLSNGIGQPGATN
jgi:lysophospholipase L1-like esterase